MLSAALLAPLALLCVWLGGPAFTGLIVLAALGLSLEWVALCDAPLGSSAALAVVASVLLAAFATGFGAPLLGLGLLAVGFAAAWAIGHRAVLAGGVPYVGIATVALIWLRQGGSQAGLANILFLVLVVWASDIGAYAVGRVIGGPKLAPRLSPGKTRAGAVGGLLAAVAVGLAIAAAFSAAGPLAAILAAVLGIACQAGDLFESGIKRRFGVKDSGRLIPGHGGLLDRLDGLLAAAPVAALAMLVGRGGLLWQ